MRDLFLKTSSARERRDRWLRSGVPVTVGLGLVLLALAGCGQASPSVSRSQVPTVTIVPAARWAIGGDPLQFHVHAEPAPSADLTISVTIASRGCGLAQSQRSLTITAGAPDVPLQVPTTGLEVGEQDCEVTATIVPGEGYAVGSGGLARSATVVITPRETPGVQPRGPGEPSQANSVPRVTIEPVVPYVTVGGKLQFRLSADPPPAAPLTVDLLWRDRWGVLDGTPPRTATIPTSGEVTISAATDSEADVSTDSPASVLVRVAAGTGYTVGPGVGAVVRSRKALPFVSVEPDPDVVSVNEGDTVSFTLISDPAPAAALTVYLNWTNGHRFAGDARQTVTIPASATAVGFVITTLDDAIHNDIDDEVVGFVLVKPPRNRSYAIGSPAHRSVKLVDDEYSGVSVVANSASWVAEGSPVSFTFTAHPVPKSDLAVNVDWTVKGGGSFAETPSNTLTITTSGTTTLTLTTIDDIIYRPPWTVDVEVEPGQGYFPQHPSRATVTVLDVDDD